jgi:hypothetical protein
VGVLFKSQAVALPEVQWWRSSRRAFSGAQPTELDAQSAHQAASKTNKCSDYRPRHLAGAIIISDLLLLSVRYVVCCPSP